MSEKCLSLIVICGVMKIISLKIISGLLALYWVCICFSVGLPVFWINWCRYLFTFRCGWKAGYTQSLHVCSFSIKESQVKTFECKLNLVYGLCLLFPSQSSIKMILYSVFQSIYGRLSHVFFYPFCSFIWQARPNVSNTKL